MVIYWEYVIEREVNMADLKATVGDIEGLEVRTKVVEEKEDGNVVDHHLMTTIKFDIEDMEPNSLSLVLWAMKAGKAISVTFHNPQAVLDLVGSAESAHRA